MKKLVTIFAVAMCSTLVMAQTNQYFWYNGNLIMGNPINQVDSITFGQIDEVDSITLYLPHTIKVVHDTVYVAVHDTINPCDIPDGAISGKFSVSPTKQVYFSKGNLQYQASTNTWRFAENQWDYMGQNNIHTSSTYSGWIDLFAWGTGNNPTLWDTIVSPYTQFDDWGNNISQDWYTLSQEEWSYLLSDRTNASKLCEFALIDSIKGFIFYPDNYVVSGKITNKQAWGTNLSIADWNLLEKDGAVFIPTAGVRWYEDIERIHGCSDSTCPTDCICGNYWSSSTMSTTRAYYFVITDCYEPKVNLTDKICGCSVRLVQDVK